ncbi:MAG TPA: LacI family DNA-binding transcriptional regulator [Candidatus Limnocylindrales bacterium]|nr:LacI family DNA-binding transcriptional regulator [Candidatus Limnocylindrales bacterium]
MSRKKTARSEDFPAPDPEQPVNLKSLAEFLGLAPATISLVMNRSPASRSIPKRTKDRILAEAKRLNYRPNFLARSLRHQRSFTIGVVVPEVSEGYAAMVMSGIEDDLLREGYFYFVVSHRHRADLIEEYPKILLERAVEGIIAVDTPCERALPVPIVSVSGHREVEGVTNIVLDHSLAARLALQHLFQLGHRKIAFIKGQAFSSDTESRWRAIHEAAGELGLCVNPKLTARLEGDSSSPALGYEVTKQLLNAGDDFTALFAFNDVSAIGAMRAIRDAGRTIPGDISVVGFDDIQSAAFQSPGLTTVRQPLRRMGEIAAQTLLQRIDQSKNGRPPKSITVEPELIIRESTAAASR